MKEYKILSTVNNPEQLKNVPRESLHKLCDEVRDFLIETVEKNGGHLASNLGVVELSVALHRVFDCPSDHIIFDVGHQAYIHKLFTERKDKFGDLRKPGGLSGFTLRKESAYDCFGAGHSSTSVSAALGFAESDKIDNNGAYTVCVIGDGAYTGGMVHEALNNCKEDLRLIIILNENGMSISKNEGSFASYISKFRFSKGYIGWKRSTISFLGRIPLLGKPIRFVLASIRDFIKRLVYKPNYFEELGLSYIGPLDGHNYDLVERALVEAKRNCRTTVVHLKTVKGKGYKPAELEPGTYHSVNSRNENKVTFHSSFAEELSNLAEKNEKIIAITAAMGVGTGLDRFGKEHPNRYFDVGIAEEHALTFAAGLAAAGKRPFVAIYSTFLQRGYDNILHDIALQDLPVSIIVDRAGIAKSDGATHHGIFDVSFLSHIPGITIYAPASYRSLKKFVYDSSLSLGPCVIRYSNASEDPQVVKAFFDSDNYSPSPFRCSNHYDSPEVVFITYGSIVSEVLKASRKCCEDGISSGVILLEVIKPLNYVSESFLELIKNAKHVIFVEEGIKNGGVGLLFGERLRTLGIDIADIDYTVRAIDDTFLIPESVCDYYDYAELSSGALYQTIKGKING